MSTTKILSATFAVFITTTCFASYKMGVVVSPQGSKIVSLQRSFAKTSAGQKKRIRHLPQFLFEDQKPSLNTYDEYLYDDAAMTPQLMQLSLKLKTERVANGEVRTIVQQGPKENRINLTIVGDGYTLAEKDRFFEDAKRTTDNLFTGSTFASYLPLFNVYAVFVPSNQSGIGDGQPKDTALGLYRSPKGSKRGIMCSRTGAADKAIAMAPATDYPILLANDEFYGGLGGQYAISTRSVRSGMIVLRHELGHNFGDVGEEYDGGQVYTGANYSSTTNVPWAHWAKNGVQVNEAINLGGQYLWTNLSGGPIKVDFTVPSGPYKVLTDISSVGWKTEGDVEMQMDGQKVQLPGPFSEDRAFFRLNPSEVPSGSHRFTFTEQIHDGDNVLAYYRIYALPAGYDLTPNKIGAFATFSEGSHKVGYRPTHESCLMRDMTTPHFCAVDQENMWHRFLSRLSLIDQVRIGGKRANIVALEAPKLPGLLTAWYKVSGSVETEVPEYRNKLSWEVPAGLSGPMRVKVKFETSEVRRYAKYFEAQKDFTIP